MADWEFAQHNPADRLAKLHHFSVSKKAEDGQDIEFVITIREYVTPPDPMMKFHATVDKVTNQRTAPYHPCGWGKSLLEALSRCVTEISRFPYQGS